MTTDETVRVYVAGPLFGSGRSTENVHRTLKVAELVIEAGGVPFVPHLFHLWDTVSPHEADYWLSMDKAWLQKCDGLLVIPGVSPGTRMEEGWAGEFGVLQWYIDPERPAGELVGQMMRHLRERKQHLPQPLMPSPIREVVMHTTTGSQPVRRQIPGTVGLGIEQLVTQSYWTAREHGWWEAWPLAMTMRRQESSRIAEKIALMHSELSEALEEVRKKDNHGLGLYHALAPGEPEHPKPEGFVVELADVMIRIADLCGALNLDLEGAIQAKLAYNETRSYKHGGKTI